MFGLPQRSLIPVPVLLAVLLLLPASVAGGREIRPVSVAELEAMIRAESRGLYVAMAAWCGPCRKELPGLNEIHADYGKKGLAVIGLSLDIGGPEALKPILAAEKVRFPVYWLGEEGMFEMELYPIPLILVVRDGEVVKRLEGYKDEAELRAVARDLLN